MKVITSIDDAVAAVGEELGVSEWQEIDQDRINAFADATGDHQWIHIDAERAKDESPYGQTIAHGFLTLSMIPALTKDNYRVENAKMAITDEQGAVHRVVLSAGEYARSELIDATKVDDNTVNMTVKNTIELDGSDKPAAVAETIVYVALASLVQATRGGRDSVSGGDNHEVRPEGWRPLLAGADHLAPQGAGCQYGGPVISK
jgi:acyl dehydratase